MKKFLILYRAPVSAEQQMAMGSAEDAAKGMEAWMAWGAAAGEAIVDFGAPLSDPEGGAEGYVGGFSILQAESAEELNNLIAEHPHRQVGTIQVLEFLPAPGNS